MTTPLLQPVISPTLVGRDEHLAALDGLVARSRSGAGVTLLVSGEAGIGKSRLVAEARARFGGFVLQGNCFEHDRSLPYAPFIDLLRGLLAVRPDEIEAIREHAPDLLPELVRDGEVRATSPRDPEQAKQRTFEALLRTVSRLAGQQPLLVVVEDVHWADDLSLQLLHRLAQRVAGQPVLLLVTWRSDEVSERLGHLLAAIDRGRLGVELRLERLAKDDVEAMLRAIFDQPQPIRPDFLRMVVELTDGNPFFIEEVISALIASGDIYRSDDGWTRKEVGELRIPRSVVAAVQERVRGLSAPARRVLDLAAVSGQRCDFDVLRELAGVDEDGLLRLLRELIDARLVVEISAQQFAFRHALTREAVYAGLLARERRALHLAIAGTIERLYAEMLDPHIADLSYHYYTAEAWTETLTFARHAAERAQALYAPNAEIEHIDRALDAAAHLSLVPPRELYRQRALAAVTLGQFARAERDHATALDLARQAGDQRTEWQSLLDIGALWSGRDYGRAGAAFQQAYDLAQAIADPALVARSLVQLGNWQVNIERPDEAEQSLVTALTIFEAAGDRQQIAETVDLLGIVSDISGDVARMRERLERAIALYRELGDRRGLSSTLTTMSCTAGIVVYDSSVVPTGLSIADAVALFDESLAIAREIGWRAGEAYAWLTLALVLLHAGEFSRALEAMVNGSNIAEEIAHREWMAAAGIARGLIERDLFETDQAVATLERAYHLARESGSLFFVNVVAGCLISAYVAAGDLDRAAATAAIFPKDLPFGTAGQCQIWLARAELANALCDPETALSITARIRAAAPNATAEADMPAVARQRGEALALRGDLSQAIETLQAAAAGAVARTMRPYLWRVRATLARLYAGSGCDAEAARELQAARETIDELEATIADDLRRAAFRDRALALLPVSTPHETAPLHSPLTRREQEVARLVARGLTNREVADALFVGERTVETHVGNILGKLGFASRAQIAVWVVESGIVTRDA